MTKVELDRLPRGPGVYLMKGAGGEVLYIGKAKKLRARVRSYFVGRTDGRYGVRFLATRVRSVDCIVTANEKEALILEDTLLKKHKPRYNIRLKDDKTYVSIKLTTHEKFPRILVTRKIIKDGSRYFGPYASAGMVRDTVKFLRRIFPLCICTPHEFRNRTRPCLDFQLGICSSPATGLISEADYGELVRGAVMFLEGRNRELVKRLKLIMIDASKCEEFEQAAALRDRVASIESVLEEQKVVTTAPSAQDQDVFALARDGETLAVVVLFIREGRLVGTREFTFPDRGLPPGEILSSVATQFYRRQVYVPIEVLLSAPTVDAEVIGQWLSERRAKKVVVRTPRRGRKSKLVKMAEDNALEALRKKTALASVARKTLLALKSRLRLKALPRLIEAFDISNIGGDHAVGAMVAFSEGMPDKSRYRLFKIRSVKGPDDYAMMEEVLTRRYAAARSELTLPDLILIDGGKGQLAVAAKVMAALESKGPALVSIAKEKVVVRGSSVRAREVKADRVYLPGVKDAVILREGTAEDLLIRRIRDEVHRFAISYHRGLRQKALVSALDAVPGVGPKRRAALLTRFGDVKAIRKASIEDIAGVPGISEDLAKKVRSDLN